MKPRALQKGDTVALVTPASPLTEDKLTFVTDLLHSAGYRVVRGKHVLAASDYLAGSDEQRAEDLMWAFDDPEVDAVVTTRGGYGCARLFPYLDLDRIVANPKLFVGFSDVTALHIALNNRGMATVHGPMALTLAYKREPWVHESFLRLLRGDTTPPEEAPVGICEVPGIAEGVVVGGCLCLLTDSVGTCEALNCEGRILLIEDVDERPHRIDAMLTNLLNSGTVQKAAGIVVGEMTRTDEPQNLDETIGGRGWRDIFRDRLGGLGIPMIFDYPFGHKPNQLSLALGIRARLEAEAGTLTYLESLCA